MTTTTPAIALYVHTRGVSLRLDGNAVAAHHRDLPIRRMPLLNIAEIVVFGSIHISTKLIHRCAADRIQIVWMNDHGRFMGRLQGPTTGNVHLRRAQHASQLDTRRRLDIARSFVHSKALGSARFAADSTRYGCPPPPPQQPDAFHACARRVAHASSLDELLGIEGDLSKRHFANLASSLRSTPFPGRTRRPPTDPVNAALSFTYALATTRCVGAAETVGLDPQLGFLHTDRPGRPSLALDLLEPVRPIADRVVVTLFNRRALNPDSHFERHVTGAVTLNEDGRRILIDHWAGACADRRVRHDATGIRTTVGLLPHHEARVIARTLRDDLPAAHISSWVEE